MLGQPIYINLPKIIGVKLLNKLRPGVTATDLALSITSILRHYGVISDVVEFFGEGTKYLDVPDRATVSNMAPEYGALMGLFGIDELTLKYFSNTGKTQDTVELINCYYKTQKLFDVNYNMIQYNHVIELDLSTVESCVAGPRRPEDKLLLNQVKYNFNTFKQQIEQEKGHKQQNKVTDKSDLLIKNGDIVIAAITSCTNTANPGVIIAAALLAKNALNAGLKCPDPVLRIFAPGSKGVEKYLKQSGLLTFLEDLGFYISAYGCAACVGNIGALNKDIEECIINNELVVTAILSGNRNFDARVHSLVRGNYLMSPPLVLAYALAGNIKIDLTQEPIGYSKQGPVFLKDIWPAENEIKEYDIYVNNSNNYIQNYSSSSLNNKLWNDLQVPETDIYDWNDLSTYIKQPPFFANQHLTKNDNINICNARALMILEDSITTDHISPAGKILAYTPAARYLNERNDNYYNTYGARRGNHEVMLLGAFSNPHLNNFLSSKKGQYTRYYPQEYEGELNTIAEEYIKESTPTMIFAGYNYGAGSSRDWAAKVTKLLGVRAVVAKSFERIHRSNLLYMGVLPCQFKYPERVLLEHYVGNITFNLVKPDDNILSAGMILQLEIYDNKKNIIETVPLLLRLDNDFEINCYLKGGILPLAVENLLN
jgi:aconitate hydratase